MAIFKILEGSSSRIDFETTPFHKGWAYFTPDDGKLYIDSLVDNVETRVCVSGGGSATPVSATLLASGWNNGTQTIAVSELTATSNGVVGLAQTVSDAQYAAAQEAGILMTAQANGTATFTVMGDSIPTIDIPILFIIC